MSFQQYEVEFVKPGGQFIEPDSECIPVETGVKYKAGKLGDGRWVAWIPYWERKTVQRKGTPIRAIAENKHVAAGAVRDYYENER